MSPYGVSGPGMEPRAETLTLAEHLEAVAERGRRVRVALQVSDNDVIKAALRRLIMGRALLGYELAAERLGEEMMEAQVLSTALAEVPPLDRERVAAVLTRVLGESPSNDVIDLVAHGTQRAPTEDGL